MVARLSPLLAAALALGGWQAALSNEPDQHVLERAYPTEILPLLRNYCFECHSTDLTEAQIDLGSIGTWAEVRKHPQTWQKVAEMLGSGQMPPPEASQPNQEERNRVQQWVRDYLTWEAKARAGDPGRVVLRRLSNAEYTYTLRDLTGVASLNPAHEFPVDGAAGEGFTNTGNALVMSPALVTKYLDAAKEISNHAVLLPDGMRFSPHATRRDWTDDLLAQIRGFYREFTDAGGSDQVNLEGVVFGTNEGGRLPLERYLAATLKERDSLASEMTTIEAVAAEYRLNARYLGRLWNSMNSGETSFLLERVRARWRTAKPDDATALAGEIATWQKALWTFNTVGQIDRVGGARQWQEPVTPLLARQELRFKIPAATEGNGVMLSLVASDAGDGDISDFVVWERPRLVAPGRPDVLLRDVRDLSRNLAVRRERMFGSAARCLQAADEMVSGLESTMLNQLAQKHQVDVDVLSTWLDYLGAIGRVKIENHFIAGLANVSGHDFINGWGSNETPYIVTNSSDQAVRISGDLKPHSVAVHPSPTLRVAVGWESPVAASIKVEANIKHAHPGCGNGVTWSLELRRGAARQRLAGGALDITAEASTGPLDNISVRPGDLVSLLVGPRDGSHGCDLTAIDLKLTESGDQGHVWNLAEDISSDVLAGNPHADRLGNLNVWHFYTEVDKEGSGPIYPAGSILAKWQTAKDATEKQALADALQAFLLAGEPAIQEGPDAQLYRELTSAGGPLFAGGLRDPIADQPKPIAGEVEWGLDPAQFGKHPDGSAIDGASLCVQAPSVIAFQLPANLTNGCELVADGVLDGRTGVEGSVELQVVAGKVDRPVSLKASDISASIAAGEWGAESRKLSYTAPILVGPTSETRKRIEAGFEEFRQLFPVALSYVKIVPVDEPITLTLFHREDDHLVRLMLNDEQAARLDRMWAELRYISQDAIVLVDVLEQLIQYATQDRPNLVVALKPVQQPFAERAANFQQYLVDTEHKHWESLLAFASSAYRRPLSDAQCNELQAFYHGLRNENIPHEEAFRLTLARVLVAPAFLYKIEKPGPAKMAVPVTDWELASRLSYFLWSSQPDDELRQVAATGTLKETDTLLAQTRRMLHDAKTRRLATEFACQWLHIYDFDQLDEKSERHFPTFIGLRDDMYEESIQFFTDLFQNNGSVLDILNADYTFLNEDLAKHYDIPGVAGPQWRRVDGANQFSRGGILAQATTLGKQSGASRTSPILRGNWVSEALLGERLPRPPKGVPQLPDDETATEGLTVRQLVEKHSSDARCSICHKRIDAFGFSLEGFDAIGRRREKDLADRPIDTRATTMDGTELEGLDGLRKYLSTVRQDAFLRQFCRKLLGYSLGRAVQLSDEPLLAEMQSALRTKDYRVAIALEAIVRSPQFRDIRGREMAQEE